MVIGERLLPGSGSAPSTRAAPTAAAAVHAHRSPGSTRREGDRLFRSGAVVPVAWSVVAMAAVATAVAAGSALGHVLAFAATWVISTTLPGTLLWRALARPTSTVEAVAFGNVAGMGLLLLAWLPAVLLGDARLAWWGPLTVMALFVSVPRLRKHWRSPGAAAGATPPRWHVAMAAVSLVALVRMFVVELRALPLPGTADTRVHPDMWFQLALVDQLQRTPLVEEPQVAGISMSYHWFANADIAAISSMSGTPTPTVLFHLWLIAMMLTVLLSAAALARRLLDPATSGSRRHDLWWVGPLAALVSVAVPVVLVLGEPRLRNLDSGFQVVSPSGILGLVLVLVISGALVDLVRRRNSRGDWVMTALLMALAAGTKPSILPVVIAALLLVSAYRWIADRTPPVGTITLSLLGTGLVGIAMVTVSGGQEESEIDPFRTLDLDQAMQLASSGADRSGTWAVTLGLLALYVATELPRLLGLFGAVHRHIRRDPATSYSAGVVFAGFSASWLLHHPGFSQQYFWRVVIVFAVVSTIVAAVRVVPRSTRRQRRVWVPLLCVVLAGLAVGTWVLGWEPADPAAATTGPFDRLLPYGLAVSVVVAAICFLRLPPLRSWLPRLPVLTLVIAFTFAAGVPAAVADLAEPTRRAVQGAPPAFSERQAPRLVTAEEQQAALWLRQNAGPEDHVVTNVMCVPTPYRSECEATAFWVAALSGRPVVLGGWAYTFREGEPPWSASYKQRPSPFPERLRLSREMILDPSAQTVRRLENGYGVRWVFADRRASWVSPEIARYADLVFQNRDVLIYRIP